jgi:hypothetical protein
MITQKEVHYLPNWPEQLAELVRVMWLGRDGRCYFPYQPLATPEWWRNVATEEWGAGRMLSRFLVDADDPKRIVATASLVCKGDHWEVGRFNSYPCNPKGVMLEMVRDLYSFAQRAGYRVVCETTQCHTASQFIVSQLGMRFAGYGILANVHGVTWDILYFDNHQGPDFMCNQAGLINDLLGVPMMAGEAEKNRLAEIPGIISIEKTSGFPPQKFHIYEKYLPHLESILRMNVSARV